MRRVGRRELRPIATATVLNPAVLEGWGVRPYDWQFSASVQQQIMPRVSAEFGYSRRSWGNFFFTDNRAVGPRTSTPSRSRRRRIATCRTAGRPFSYALLKDSAFGELDNYYTFASDYGDVDYHWQGLDLSVDARPRNGLTLQGGFTTGAGSATTATSPPGSPELLHGARRAAAAASVPRRRSPGCGPGAVWSTTCSRRSTSRSADSAIDGEHSRRPTTRPRTAHRWPPTTS